MELQGCLSARRGADVPWLEYTALIGVNLWAQNEPYVAQHVAPPLSLLLLLSVLLRRQLGLL